MRDAICKSASRLLTAPVVPALSCNDKSITCMPSLLVIPFVVLGAVLYYGYFVFRCLKARWTVARLFSLSLLSVLVLVVSGVVLLACWWPLAFDWDPGVKPALLADAVGGAGCFCLSGGGLALIVASVCGIILHARKARVDPGSQEQEP